jgi:hypothetical protein
MTERNSLTCRAHPSFTRVFKGKNAKGVAPVLDTPAGMGRLRSSKTAATPHDPEPSMSRCGI